MHRFLIELCSDDRRRASRIGLNLGFDWSAKKFLQRSKFIAGTPSEFFTDLRAQFPEIDRRHLEVYIYRSLSNTPQILVPNLDRELCKLRSAGYILGVATNDSAEMAKSQLEANGLLKHFEFLAGYNSGFSSKPNPAMLLAFCTQVGVQPEATVMVGDSWFDLTAGKRAEMHTVGVLTGVATRDELEPLADKVLEDIQELPSYLLRLEVQFV